MKRSIKIPITFQQLEGDGYHIFTRLRIFDDEVFVLIDTGASKTVFSEKLIEKYPALEIVDVSENIAAGIGEDKISAKIVCFPLLQLGRIKIANHYCGLISFNHVNIAYESMGLTTFDGIIGGDILKMLNAEINYKEAYMKLYPF